MEVWNPRVQGMWARRRELAVTVGVAEELLAEVDSLVSDGTRALRAPDSWWRKTVEALRRVDEAIIARVGEGNVPAQPFYGYRRVVDAEMAKRYAKIDAELVTAPVLVCEGYVITSMLYAKDEMKDILADMPSWKDAMGEAAYTAMRSKDPETQARALAQAIFDLA